VSWKAHTKKRGSESALEAHGFLRFPARDPAGPERTHWRSFGRSFRSPAILSAVLGQKTYEEEKRIYIYIYIYIYIMCILLRFEIPTSPSLALRFCMDRTSYDRAASPEGPSRRASPEGPWCRGFLGSPGGENKNNYGEFLAKRRRGETAGRRSFAASTIRRCVGSPGSPGPLTMTYPCP
jgi:hypothetical protein